MFQDPKALTAIDWQNIHLLLQWLWIYLPLIVTGSVTLVTAHAVIPSLVITGHLPPPALRLRVPLTAFAVVVLAVAAVVIGLALNQATTVENFWDRNLF
ncbi:MAG: hypothetical protein IIC99_04500 [Chloroflexi bacterium]|nr:hypothetical protein [Chloroflexota bacterium]